MQLADGNRQIVAGLAASVAFLASYLGLGLVWWAAMGLALPVFVATLLIVGRKPPPTEEYVADGVSKAEITQAINAITDASKRMRQLAISADGQDKAEFQKMASLFEAIRGHHMTDPRDYRHTRRFIRHEMPRIVQTADAYLDLAAKASGGNRDRVEALGQRIRGFTPVLEKIDQACLENDFMALEVQVDVLGQQLESR